MKIEKSPNLISYVIFKDHGANLVRLRLWHTPAWTREVYGSDFDIIGFSYYGKWSNVAVNDISRYVSDFKSKFNKEVMIVETAYPWTGENADSYTNIFSVSDAEPGYPVTPEGQLKYMTDLTQEIVNGGGMGIMVWEPAWITSSAKDLWGTGSAWDNCTFFDVDGNVNQGIDFMLHQ